MKTVIQEKILTLIFCVAITAVIVKFISKSAFYVSHPSLSISLIVAVAVIISNVIVTKLVSRRG